MKDVYKRQVSDGTDNHLMLVDLTPFGLTGKSIEKLLDAAHILSLIHILEKSMHFVQMERYGILLMYLRCF